MNEILFSCYNVDADVTNVGIMALAHVHTLTLYNLPRVTDVGIAALAHVNTLELQHLPLVTNGWH